MSESDSEFLERLSHAGDAKEDDFNRLFALARRGAAPSGWEWMREEAAKVAADLADKWAGEWREGLKCDSYLEGKSDGADEVAEAIRTLPPTPAERRE